MIRIEEVMTRDPALCTPDDSVVDCAKLMAREDVGLIPVVESRETRKLIGVVTDRDLCMTVIAEGRDPNECKVEEAMSDEPITVGADEALERALELMKRHQIRRVCVIDEDGASIGVLSQADVVRAAPAKEVKRTVTEISKPATD
jgi:CBS domain-containing protein